MSSVSCLLVDEVSEWLPARRTGASCRERGPSDRGQNRPGDTGEMCGHHESRSKPPQRTRRRQRLLAERRRAPRRAAGRPPERSASASSSRARRARRSPRSRLRGSRSSRSAVISRWCSDVSGAASTTTSAPAAPRRATSRPTTDVEARRRAELGPPAHARARRAERRPAVSPSPGRFPRSPTISTRTSPISRRGESVGHEECLVPLRTPLLVERHVEPAHEVQHARRRCTRRSGST